jgi:hypothetical protein
MIAGPGPQRFDSGGADPDIAVKRGGGCTRAFTIGNLDATRRGFRSLRYGALNPTGSIKWHRNSQRRERG